jgi:CO/xanthine dehydrogenase FAD-binding subunit
MPITHEFEYLKPKNLAETAKALGKAKAKAMILAGGTDIVGHLKEDLVTPGLLIDIKGLKELKKIEFKNGSLQIGALVTFSELIDSKLVNSKFPVLVEISKKVASVGIRNRATMVGNICSAVPCLDSGPVLVGMDAVVHLKGPRGQRKIPATKWFTGPRKTARKPDELVTSISIPLPKEKFGACYVKLGRYQGEDLAQASVFVCVTKGKSLSYRVAFGSVGPTPKRGLKIEKLLVNEAKATGSIGDESIARAKHLVPSEITPITDIRASKEYRLHMCQVMLERALRAAETRLKGQGPLYGENLI